MKMFTFSRYVFFLSTIFVTEVFSQEIKENQDTGVLIMQAKRVPPNVIKPIIIDNMRIEVIHWGKKRGLEQNGGYIVAFDKKTEKELWVLKVYNVKYDLKMEEDVQDIFIEKISKTFFTKKIKIIDENGTEYLIDPETKEIVMD